MKDKIREYIIKTKGIPGGVEEKALMEFYKENGRLPGELWTPIHTIICILFGTGFLLILIEFIITNLK